MTRKTTTADRTAPDQLTADLLRQTRERLAQLLGPVATADQIAAVLAGDQQALSDLLDLVGISPDQTGGLIPENLRMTS